MKLAQYRRLQEELTIATMDFIVQCGKESMGGMDSAMSRILDIENDLRGAGLTETQIEEARQISNNDASNRFFEIWTNVQGQTK